MSYQSKYTGSEIDAGIDAAKAALPKNGGTMLGALILAGDPADENAAVTKKYVDNAVKNIELTPGENGEDGVSVTHSWNGTVLSVTSASGTSSADLKGEKGDTGADGQIGADGVSPTVSIATISGGHRVTITDAEGEKSFDVMDGENGSGGGSGGSGADGEDGATFTPSVSSEGVLSWTNDKGLTNPDPVNIKGDTGADGDDGFSPDVTVEEITGGHRVTITDASGTKSFDVMDGVGGSGGPGSGDMLKSTYDTDGSGVVDDAEMLGGQPPSYYEIPEYLKKNGGEYSVSDDMVQLENDKGMPLNVVTTIKPVQSGNGDPSPTNIRPITGHNELMLYRVGKNLFGMAEYGTVDGSGNEQHSSSNMRTTYIPCTPGEKFAFSKAKEFPDTKNGMARLYDADKNFIYSTAVLEYNALNNVWTVPDGVHYFRFVQFAYGSYTDAFLQIERGDVVTDYDGRFDSFTATFDQTVYGGTMNWNTGVFAVEWGLISSYAGETLPGEWISDRDVYSEGATPTTGAQVCYKLETPTTIQFTQHNIYAFDGTNTFYSDAGTTTVTGSKNIFAIIAGLTERINDLEAATVNNA